MSCTWFDFSSERVCHQLGCFGKRALLSLIILFVGHQVHSQRYPDTQLIDVVNEPLHDPPHYKKALGGDAQQKQYVRTPNLLEQFGGRGYNFVGLQNKNTPGGRILIFYVLMAAGVRHLLD
jgi:hypothetical protein